MRFRTVDEVEVCEYCGFAKGRNPGGWVNRCTCKERE